MSYEDTGYNGFGGSQIVGGGGHFASPSQGTMQQYGSGSGSATKKRDPQSLTRVTVKQCMEAEELPGDKFSVDGRPVPQVSLLANVLTVSYRETNVELTVEDGTGTIPVRMYLDNDGEQPQQIKEGEYRMIVGGLKKLGGARCVVAFTVAPVTDHNQLTMHMLDVIYTHLRVTKGPPGAKGEAGANGFPKAEGGLAMGGGFGGGMQVDQFGGQVAPGGAGGSVRDQVLHVFQYGPGADTDSGCSINDVCAQLSHLGPGQVQEAVVALSNDGHLYSTIDEEHYKTTAQ